MASVSKPRNVYLWFDTEFTSLDFDTTELLQVAVMATDDQLVRLTPPENDLNLVLKLNPDVEISPWVQQNLGSLLEACRGDDAVSLAQADAALVAYLDEIVSRPDVSRDRPVLAGNSIHGDWLLARKYLPRFTSRLHYRHLDVTSVKLEWQNFYEGGEFNKEDTNLIRQYFPDAGCALDTAMHDAHYDVIASAAELAYYRAGLRKFLELAQG